MPNQAEDGTVQIIVNPIKVQDVMAHPVPVLWSVLGCTPSSPSTAVEVICEWSLGVEACLLQGPVVAEEVAGGADLLVRVADVHARNVAVHGREAVQEDEEPEDGRDDEL